jgi:serine/threonine protein kinase
VSKKSDQFIAIPENLDYRATDFYDMDEDERDVQSSQLYEEFSDVNKRYTEVTEIASGGMKIISRTYDQKTGRYVAMATVKENLGKDSYGPFLAEARLTAALHHPNIINVHDIGYLESGTPYFTMDLKLGDSLNDILRKLNEKSESYETIYTNESLLNIFIKICDAVSYSHSQSVLHLDIKPENVQVGDHGEVLLCDWGLARQLGDKTRRTEELLDIEFLNGQTIIGKVRGTPGFLAPELLKDKTKRNIQTDIYSLGAVLYSILTHKEPIAGDNVADILEKTKKGFVIPPLERSPEKSIPQSLNAVVMKAMAKEKQDRYQSVAELSEDVRKYLFGFATSAENAGFAKEFILFYKRNRNSSRIAGLAVLVVVVVTYAFIVNLERSRQQEHELRLVAEQQKKKAEENFEKYKEEKEMADLTLSTDPSVVLVKLKELYHRNFLMAPKETLDEIMRSLERIKESNDSAILLYEFKGDVHFVRQEFDLALNELKKGRGPESNMNLFSALKSIEDYKSGSGYAPLPVIKTLIKSLNGNFLQQQVRMMLYDGKVRANKEEHLKLVEMVFKEINRTSDVDEFKFDYETKTLTISGDFVRCSVYIAQFDQQVSLISTLKPEHLILKKSKRFNTSSLDVLKLKSLDLSEMPLLQPNKVVKKGVTDKLIISEKLTNPELIELLQEENNLETIP